MSPSIGGVDGMTLGAAVVGGALIGSAAGAAATRWPEGGSLRTPLRSRCDRCGAEVRARDLVPIASWVALRGRCRTCGDRIDRRHVALEVSVAIVLPVMVIVRGPSFETVLLALGAVALFVASATDLSHRIIPDRLTRPLAVVGVGGLVVTHLVGSGDLMSMLGGLAWPLGVPAALWAFVRSAERHGRPRPVGGGDIKLLVGVLALAGLMPTGGPTVLLLTILIAGSFACVGLAIGRLERRSRMPMAPAITGAFVVATLAPSWVDGVLWTIGGPAWSR